MTGDTRPSQPVTPVTVHPSRRHPRCDGREWALACANGSCDGCDGFRSTPSRPSPTASVQRCGSPAARPVTPGREGAGLPLPPLSVPTPLPSLYYTVTPIDARGRLADRSPIRALGWRPGQPVTITVTEQVVVVTAQAGGAESITRQGHLRLSARIRHACRLNAGDRVLVAAAPTPGVLAVYTMALLESILREHHATTSSGEAPR